MKSFGSFSYSRRNLARDTISNDFEASKASGKTNDKHLTNIVGFSFLTIETSCVWLIYETVEEEGDGLSFMLTMCVG